MIDLTVFDSLVADGWSFTVGYSQEFSQHLVRIWKMRDKPIRMMTVRHKPTISFMWVYSGVGYGVPAAIEDCIKNKELKIEEERTQ